jgi:hypothetical protein
MYLSRGWRTPYDERRLRPAAASEERSSGE